SQFLQVLPSLPLRALPRQAPFQLSALRFPLGSVPDRTLPDQTGFPPNSAGFDRWLALPPISPVLPGLLPIRFLVQEQPAPGPRAETKQSEKCRDLFY